MSTLNDRRARAFRSLMQERDSARAKLAAVYSILARREVAYGDEVEGLILTAAHVAATAEAKWARSQSANNALRRGEAVASKGSLAEESKGE